jgi:hypothetical protein
MLRSAHPWFRSDTISAAQLCLGEGSCRDITRCLEAWQRTVFVGGAKFMFFGLK